MSAPAKCELCGEPMPAGEDMFNFHGYSGPCPKPPLPKPRLSPFTWHPMSEHPTPPVATAMIRCTDEQDGPYLLPGPVMWSPREECWVDEATCKPVQTTDADADAVYDWCYEREITGGKL